MTRLFIAFLIIACSVVLLCSCDLSAITGGVSGTSGTTTTTAATQPNPNAPPTPGMQYQKSTDGHGYIVRGYAGKVKDLVIAEENLGLPVTAIMQGAFSGKSTLTSIRIPTSITSIGKDAFKGCTGLIGTVDGVQYVDHWAVGVGEYIGKIELREDIVGIANNAFEGRKNLMSVTLGSKLVHLGENAFLGCTSLTEIKVHENNPCYSATADALYNKDKTVLIRYFGTAESFTIPYSVVEIAPSAFRDHSELKSITLSRGGTLKAIGEYAFAGCTSLITFTIPKNLTRIEKGLFSGCTSLESIRWNDGGACAVIGAEAFRDCASLTTFTISKSITEIGQNAFYGCEKLATVKFEVTSGWMVGGQHLMASQISTPAQAAGALRSTYRVKTWVRQN